MFDDEKPKREITNPVQIRLKGSGVYAPGDDLTGNFEIYPDTTIRCRGVELQIGWRTEGKGMQDEHLLVKERYDIEELPADEMFHERFDFTLPETPHSFAGYYINIVWFVHVKVDIAMAKDLNAEQRFIVKPPGPMEQM